MKRSLVFVLVAVFVMVAGGCGGDGDAEDGAGPDSGVRIASFDFEESELLAEAYAQVIESIGVPVIRLGAGGQREIMAPAMERGLIDLIPEYLGTTLVYRGATATNADTASALEDLNGRLLPLDLVALAAAPAENKNVFVVTAADAERFDLVTVSDLIPESPSWKFGGPAECRDRLLCFQGLRDVYGVSFAEFVPQGSLEFTAEALRRDEIDVGLLFSTAPELDRGEFVELVDDKELQPAENVVPVIRAAALERWGPGVGEALDRLSGALTTEDLRLLNLRVAQGGEIQNVVGDWLLEQTLVD